MIISFSVENFLSFKEEVTLSFVADPDDESLPENTFTHPALGDTRLLKSAILFGANASGKSNFLNALTFLDVLISIGHSFQISDDIFNEIDKRVDEFRSNPFLLARQKAREPSHFNIMYLYDHTVYEYDVALNHADIVKESLKIHPVADEAFFVFNRTGSKIEYVSPKATSDDLTPRQLEKVTLPNNLFLAKAVSLGDNYLKTPFEGLNKHLWEWNKTSRSVAVTSKSLYDNKLDKNKVLMDLGNADFGIADINVQREEMPDEIYNDFLKIIQNPKERPVLYKTSVTRQAEGSLTFFDLRSQESQGTQKFYDMLAPLYEGCRDGDFLYIDEIERHLHPLLVAKLIERFSQQCENSDSLSHCPQLLMTAHAPHLLDHSLFRPDQIWFAKKDRKTQASELYSLLEIKGIPEGADIQQEYLEGRYSAIPMISNQLFSNLNAESEAQ